MSFVNSQQTRILLGSNALSTVVRMVKPSGTVNMIEVSTLASTSKDYIAGLAEWKLQVDGLLDNTTTAGSSWDQITTSITGQSTSAVSIAQNGFTPGSPVWVMPVKTHTFDVKAQVANAVEFSATFDAAQGSIPAIGVSLADLTAVTATANGATQDNTTGTTNGAILQLHITAVSGTTPSLTAIVQHSTNGSSWTTLGSFTAATAIGAQTVTVTGTVNRYTRVQWTVSGTTPSFTAQASIARY